MVSFVRPVRHQRGREVAGLDEFSVKHCMHQGVKALRKDNQNSRAPTNTISKFKSHSEPYEGIISSSLSVAGDADRAIIESGIQVLSDKPPFSKSWKCGIQY